MHNAVDVCFIFFSYPVLFSTMVPDSFSHRGRCSWPPRPEQSSATLMWRRSSKKSSGGKEWWVEKRLIDEELEDSFHVLLENNGVIMMSIIIIIIFFLFRNARSALSWVPPSAVRSRPVWRPTTITAACRTKPSTLKTWHVASTSKLPLFKHSQSFLNRRRLHTTYIPMYCNYIIINLTLWQLWLFQLYFDRLNCSFYNNFNFKK